MKLRKLLCVLLGHNLHKMTEYNNGGSILSDHLCTRCGKVIDWQYDLP